MSVDVDRQDAPTGGAMGDQPMIRAERARPRGRVIIPLACLLVGTAIGAAGTLGIVGLSQTPQNKLSGAAAEIPRLAQPQRQADIIPTGIPGYIPGLIIEGSSRLAGRTPTASYYLSVATDGRACLLILPSGSSKPWGQACAGRLPLSVAAAGSGSARIIPSDSTTPADTIRMGLNVIVDPNSTSLVN